MGSPGNYRKIGFGGLGGGVWGAIFIVIFKKSVAQKLCRIILLHFGVVTFRIPFGKTRTPFIFMVFGPSGRDHDSQNQLCLITETPNDSR